MMSSQIASPGPSYCPCIWCGLDVHGLELDLPSCFALFAVKNCGFVPVYAGICATSELLRSILIITLLCSLILCLSDLLVSPI